MSNRSNTMNKTDDFLTISRVPIIFWILLVYVVALLLQFVNQIKLLESLFFTAIFSLHAFMHWFSYKFKEKAVWYYLALQGSLVFTAAIILPKGAPVVLIGLLTLLIAQSIVKLQSIFKVFLTFILYYGVYCLFIVRVYGLSELPLFILILFFILVIVIFYSVIYSREVKTRIRMEYYLKELELAYERVEELTLLNERQRMARDLHDTLAQGVAGLVMQMEALDAYLIKNDIEKSRHIVQMSMQQARNTLKEARQSIDSLRSYSQENKDFSQAVLKMIDEFKNFSTLEVSEQVEDKIYIPSIVSTHCLFILSECLTNIVKHANAQTVFVTLMITDNRLILKIKDDGIGFNVERKSQLIKNYGILGLQERVRLLNGDLEIKSTIALGTEVIIRIPI